MRRKPYIAWIAFGALLLVACGHLSGKPEQEKERKESHAETTRKERSEIPETDSMPETAAETVPETIPEAAPQTARLKPEEARQLMEKISASMANYLLLAIWDNEEALLEVSDSLELPLTVGEKTRAAGLSGDPDGRLEGEFIESTDGKRLELRTSTNAEEDWLLGYSLSEQSLSENCRRLFGTEAEISELKLLGNPFYDVVKYQWNGETLALFTYTEMETETDLINHEYSVTENAEGCIGLVDFYCGYWGIAAMMPGKSNFRAEYLLEESAASEYGFIIKGIRIERTAEERSWSLPEGEESAEAAA